MLDGVGADLPVFVRPSEVAGGWWRQSAACRDTDPDVFFPERGKPSPEADRICASCPVSMFCLEDGLPEKFGIWGGLRAAERRRIRSERRRPTQLRLFAMARVEVVRLRPPRAQVRVADGGVQGELFPRALSER